MMRKRESGEKAWISSLHILEDAIEVIRIPETLIYGYGLKDSTLFFSTTSGLKTVTANTAHLSDFISICGHHPSLPSTMHVPFCVSRQETRSLLMDGLSVTSAWHKATASGKQIILQRFIVSSGTHQKAAYVTWRPSGMTVLNSTSKLPLAAYRQGEKFVNNSKPEETFLPLKEPATLVQDPMPSAQLSILINTLVDTFKRHFEGEHYSELEEIVALCIQDRNQQWVLVKVKTFEVGRKMKALGQLKLNTEVFGKIGTSLKPNERKCSMTRPKSGKFGLSPAIVDVKRVLGLPVSDYEIKQALKNFKHSRKRGFVSAPPKQELGSRNVLMATEQEQEDNLHEEVVIQKHHEDMPPIFQFPTPKTPSAQNSELLLNIPKVERFGIIREHIMRQNNSLFMRIHYQEELPEKRLLRDLCTHSIDLAVTSLETLQSKVNRLRHRRTDSVK